MSPNLLFSLPRRQPSISTIKILKTRKPNHKSQGENTQTVVSAVSHRSAPSIRPEASSQVVLPPSQETIRVPAFVNDSALGRIIKETTLAKRRRFLACELQEIKTRVEEKRTQGGKWTKSDYDRLQKDVGTHCPDVRSRVRQFQKMMQVC